MSLPFLSLFIRFVCCCHHAVEHLNGLDEDETECECISNVFLPQLLFSTGEIGREQKESDTSTVRSSVLNHFPPYILLV